MAHLILDLLLLLLFVLFFLLLPCCFLRCPFLLRFSLSFLFLLFFLVLIAYGIVEGMFLFLFFLLFFFDPLIDCSLLGRLFLLLFKPYLGPDQIFLLFQRRNMRPVWRGRGMALMVVVVVWRGRSSPYSADGHGIRLGVGI